MLHRTVIFSLTLIGLFVVVPLVLYFILPNPEPPPNAPSDSEHQAVQEMVLQAANELPHVKLNKVRTTNQRVVVVEARWIGDNEPPRTDQDAWNDEADEIARIISESYLPSGWQVNVALFRTRISVLGVAARPSAEDGPEGWLQMEPEM